MLLLTDADTPQVVPGPAGDVQIEWHTLEADIELHVIQPNRVSAWRRTVDGPPEGEMLELTVDFRTVARWVGELMGADVAAGIAAA